MDATFIIELSSRDFLTGLSLRDFLYGLSLQDFPYATFQIAVNAKSIPVPVHSTSTSTSTKGYYNFVKRDRLNCNATELLQSL